MLSLHYTTAATLCVSIEPTHPATLTLQRQAITSSGHLGKMRDGGSQSRWAGTQERGGAAAVSQSWWVRTQERGEAAVWQSLAVGTQEARRWQSLTIGT